ncbi:hypothetical protein LZC95_22515 [Pendulispora brunnea]|uniref:Lipoprotein n=1 Tax=Pendulispora brunnea TaxID=2905690 RepID=A0ABZ2KQI7_9BACT
MRSPILPRRYGFAGLVALAGWLLLVPAAGACSSSSSEGDNCSQIQCINNVTLRLRVTLTADQMKDTSIHVCRNGVCSQGEVDSLPAFRGDTHKVLLTGGVPNDTTLDLAEPGKSYSVEAIIPIDDFPIDKTKDQYELRVKRGTTEVQGLAEKANYKETRPNGENCPTVCINATIGNP